MRLSTVFGLIIATASFGTSADVTLKVGSDVDLLVVNEAKPEKEGGLFSSSSTVTLPDGEHQIVFRLQKNFSRGSESELFSSQPIVATFTAKDAQLSVEFPSYRNLRQAEEFNQTMDWKLIDQDGNQISVRQDQLIKEGMQIGRDFNTEIKMYNTGAGTAVWGTTAVASTAAVAGQKTPTEDAIDSVTASGDNTAEEMLYFWYQKADPETQQRFRQAINEQADKK